MKTMLTAGISHPACLSTQGRNSETANGSLNQCGLWLCSRWSGSSTNQFTLVERCAYMLHKMCV